MSFMSKWWLGTRRYASSDVGMLESKLFFLVFVVVGLWVAGFQRLYSGDTALGIVLVAFGFVSLVDFFSVWKGLRKVKLLEAMLK